MYIEIMMKIGAFVCIIIQLQGLLAKFEDT